MGAVHALACAAPVDSWRCMVMHKYVIRRLIMTVFVVVCAAVVVFTMMFFIPGDPAEVLLGSEATPDAIAEMRAYLGIDRPYFAQLGSFLFNAFLKFDFGNSWFRGYSVLSGLFDRLPRTFLLGILTVILTTLIGIPAGVSAAIHQNKWQDRLLITLSMVFISLPVFWVALMLILIFSLKLDWLPSFGIESWTCYILPVVAGALGGFSQLARQTRASVLDVVNADYITTAQSKGLSDRVVTYKHMFPNALIPILTVLGHSLAGCIGGTVVLERIFSFPGLGLYISEAITMRDYPIIRGCIIFISAFNAIVMLLVDLAYGYVDPSIKAQYINESKKKGKISKK